MSDLRAMLVEARGERRAGDMVHLHVGEVDALIEALTPEPDMLGAPVPLSDADAATVLAMGKALGGGGGLNGPEIEMLAAFAADLSAARAGSSPAGADTYETAKVALPENPAPLTPEQVVSTGPEFVAKPATKTRRAK